MTADDETAIGAGELSAAARRRLARPSGPPLQPPPLTDLAAVDAWRAQVHRGWLDGDPPAERCGHREDLIAGRRVLRTEPVAAGPLVVYLHGGGYALGSPEVTLPITQRLAGAGLEVVSVDYRLAPEHPYPAAVDDATAVLGAVAEAEPGRAIVLAGDSAGANLALSAAIGAIAPTAAALADTEQAGNALAGLVLFSPHVDHRPVPTEPSEADRDGRPTDLDDAGARWLADAYRGPLDRNHRGLSPITADLRGLPPLLIQVGTIDTSFEQGVRLARLARHAGVDVTLDVWDGLWHTWHYHRDLPEADTALAEAATWVRRLSPHRP